MSQQRYSLDVGGACLSIIGSLDENLGLIIFPSAAGYDAFLRAEEDFASGESDDPLDLRVAEGNLDISDRGHG